MPEFEQFNWLSYELSNASNSQGGEGGRRKKIGERHNCKQPSTFFYFLAQQLFWLL